VKELELQSELHLDSDEEPLWVEAMANLWELNSMKAMMLEMELVEVWDYIDKPHIKSGYTQFQSNHQHIRF